METALEVMSCGTPRTRSPGGVVRRTRRRARPMQGFSLIEVLVSLLLFSVGMLGVVALQARASQISVQSEDRSRAALLASELVSQMWAQRSATLDAAALATWKARLADPAASGLRDGKLTLDGPGPDGVVTIGIGWTSPGRSATEAAHRYVTQVVMP